MQQTDFLTGFLSKETMYTTLDKLQAEAHRENKPLTVLLLDLDHFKAYNEKYGHLEGDSILKYFAGALRTTLLAEHMFAFRFGGDEFIIVFPDKKAQEVYHIASVMIKIFRRRPYLMGGSLLKLHFSAGIATYPTDGRKIEEIINKADRAMYFSKTHGRARATIYSHIIWKALSGIICTAVCILLSAGAVLYFNQNSYTDRAMNWLKKRAGKIGINMIIPQIEMDSTDSVTVYLKSGRVVKGTIIRDKKNEIELRLNFDTGKGTVTLRKSNIDRIDKIPEKDQ